MALPNFITRLFDNTAKDMARYNAAVAKANALEKQFENFEDARLREKTVELREQVQKEYAEKHSQAEPGWKDLSDLQRNVGLHHYE